METPQTIENLMAEHTAALAKLRIESYGRIESAGTHLRNENLRLFSESQQFREEFDIEKACYFIRCSFMRYFGYAIIYLVFQCCCRKPTH